MHSGLELEEKDLTVKSLFSEITIGTAAAASLAEVFRTAKRPNLIDIVGHGREKWNRNKSRDQRALFTQVAASPAYAKETRMSRKTE